MKLVLIDGNAVLHRAFHAIPPLTTTKGQLINAAYGFVSMLLKVKEELRPEYLIVSFDRPKPTFRQTIFVGYQAQRVQMDEGLAGQIDLVHEIVKTMEIPIYELDGFEADDVIGTLAKQAEKFKIPAFVKTTAGKQKSKESRKVETVIVTGDRDLLQLVDQNTKVYMMTKGLSEAFLYSAKEVEEKFGLTPSQFVDYKALIGDSSDNYSGVLGVGPKTAAGLLQKYQNLENIYRHLKEIPETLRLKLSDGLTSAKLAKELATIVKKAPLRLDLEKAKVKTEVNQKTIDLFQELEFRTLLRRLTGKKEEAGNKGIKELNRRLPGGRNLRIKEENKNQLGLF
ncbi:hypothetical protein HY030_04590 [Candidatus Gottesmanbacteria bacterium]|nr:hypothetical protein [Candidatus Gottesmanbacteria bacterium]